MAADDDGYEIRLRSWMVFLPPLPPERGETMSEEVQVALKGVNLGNEERVLVTCCDSWPGGVIDREAGTVFGPPRVEDVPEWMLPNAKVAFNGDGRVIDIATTTGREVRWWMVVGYCKAHGVDHVPISYDGEGARAPAELLEKAPYVAIRRASAGPWLLVATPEMRETRRKNDAMVALLRKAMDVRLNELNEQAAQTNKETV